MRIAICDDQLEVLERLKTYIRKYEEKHKLGISVVIFQDGKELLKFYSQNQDIDLIILDILMEPMDGMQVAKKLREYGTRTKIIFLTSTDQYAVQGYLVNASRYWIKPITYAEFAGEMDFMCHHIQEERKFFFCEKIGTATKKIYFSEILYIETFKRKTLVHTINDKFFSNRSMKTYELILGGREFYRCHAAYIVNMNYITEIKGLEIILKNRESIYISKNNKKNFTKAFAQYIGQILEASQSIIGEKERRN